MISFRSSADKIRSWTRQNIEYRQLLLSQILVHIALLFVSERLTQCDKSAEQFIDVSTPLVIGFNQLLELRYKVDTRLV